MAKNSVLLVGAALAASSLQAFAATPDTPSPADPTALRAAAPTGLTAADLVVGRDGAVAVDVSAKGLAVADNSSVNNSGC
jgi:hypothetical protein